MAATRGVSDFLLIASLVSPAMAGSRVSGDAAAVAPRSSGRCVRVTTTLKVTTGQTVRRRVAGDLDVVLEARASGWVVRALPHAGARPPVDFAEIATPPYRSVNPLLLTTDFAFRAQDAVGWNPREFRFAPNRGVYARLEPAYRAVTRTAKPARAEEMRLVDLLRDLPAGRVEIMDATLVPGTADRSRAAAGVPSRFNQTAHTVVDPGRGAKAEPLGRIVGLTVRISLDLPAGQAPRKLDSVETVSAACPVAAR